MDALSQIKLALVESDLEIPEVDAHAHNMNQKVDNQHHYVAPVNEQANFRPSKPIIGNTYTDAIHSDSYDGGCLNQSENVISLEQVELVVTLGWSLLIEDIWQHCADGKPYD